LAKVEITNIGFETLYFLERYMVEFISDPESLTEQLLDIAANKLAKHPRGCPVCPELEHIGVFDYLQLTIESDYKILYRYDQPTDTVFVTVFMRAKQSVEKLLVRFALLT
jgi:mRNA-degrading endonuclease RelE of RelBE toxin-antitoxin system